MVVGGCAQLPPPRMVPVDWVTTVGGLPSGTELAVYVGDSDVRYGRLETVGAQALVLREDHGTEVLSRLNVARVAVRTPTGETRVPHAIKGAAIGAVITGGLAWFATAMEENAQTHEKAWTTFVVGTLAGAAIGASWPPQQRFQERLIYVRPAK
jgi:hypothetical protein